MCQSSIVAREYTSKWPWNRIRVGPSTVQKTRELGGQWGVLHGVV